MLGKPRDQKLMPRIAPPPTAPPPSPGPVIPAEPKANAVPAPAPKPAPPRAKTPTREELMERALAQATRGVEQERHEIKPEEREGSETGSAEGTSTSAEEGDPYFTSVQAAILANYVLPSIISERERMSMKATIDAWIASDGTIVRYQFEQRSGNRFFDDALELAIKRTKVPPPPHDRAAAIARDGVALVFTPWPPSTFMPTYAPLAKLELPGHSSVQMAGLVSARFRAGMRPLAIGTALTVALSAPLADFILERHDLAHRGEVYASEVSAQLSTLVAAKTRLTSVDADAIKGLVGASLQERDAEEIAGVEVVDLEGKLLSRSRTNNEQTWPLVWSETQAAGEGTPARHAARRHRRAGVDRARSAALRRLWNPRSAPRADALFFSAPALSRGGPGAPLRAAIGARRRGRTAAALARSARRARPDARHRRRGAGPPDRAARSDAGSRGDLAADRRGAR